ncbi:MAG: SDR family NAD(P)-dependent oxidoreductase [Alphaproteobacteria bacterium]|nr:SDR family NAD(P)-dependent oxidoreductase [Alphaproteobacteria bacterium]
MRVAVLGATRGMGREVARRLAERGDTLVVLARDAGAGEAMATDLRIRGARDTAFVPCDLADPTTFAPALDAATAFLHQLDAVVVTAGLFGTQEQLEDDLDLCARVLDVDFTKTILFCEHARTRLLERGGGTLVVFSSVAGDRGRKTTGLYGATKAGLSHYLESLDHKFRSAGLVTITVKPGFIRTGMTAGLKEAPFAADADDVAPLVVKAMDRAAPVVYTPRIWQLVMLVIRYLPRFVMRRVGF